MKWRAVGVVIAILLAYGIASAMGQPVHLDHRNRIGSGGPTSSRWYLVVGEVRLAIPGTFKDLTTDNQWPPSLVLVATQLIPKGTPGSYMFRQSMYGAKPFPSKEVEDRAICDPVYLNGRVSVVDILPGQQLTETDLTASDVDAIVGRGC